MVRTQIQLEETQHKQVRQLAHQHRLSVSETVRRLVKQGLRTGLEPETPRRAEEPTRTHESARHLGPDASSPVKKRKRTVRTSSRRARTRTFLSRNSPCATFYLTARRRVRLLLEIRRPPAPGDPTSPVPDPDSSRAGSGGPGPRPRDAGVPVPSFGPSGR